ncbi:MAG TPA: hypothetical protein VF765_31245 [Polyangiaceae bacterium]
MTPATSLEARPPRARPLSGARTRPPAGARYVRAPIFGFPFSAPHRASSRTRTTLCGIRILATWADVTDLTEPLCARCARAIARKDTTR